MKKLLFSILLLGFLMPAWADILPMPEVEYSFIYNSEEKPLLDPTHSEQIQCKDALCLQQDPLGQYGAQKLSCGFGKCVATAYRFEPYQKLIVSFADGSTRQSNIFRLPPAFYTRLNVYVEPDHLRVEPSGYKARMGEHIATNLWGAFLLILILELLSAVAYLIYTQRSFVVLYSVAVGNIVSTFLAWILLPAWIPSAFVLWLACLTSEACIIWGMNRKRLSLKQAFQLSCTMNVTSYALGMILSFMFA